MNKRFLIAIFLTFIVFMGISFAGSESEKKGIMVPLSVPHAANIHQITGSVIAVDHFSKNISVQKKRGEKVIGAVITIDSQTEIREGDASKSLSDIKVGDKVIIKYTKSDNRNIAKNIEIIESEKKS